MANKNNSNIFSGLKNTLMGNWNSTNSNSYEMNSNKVLYRGDSKDEYEKAVVKGRENKALSTQWGKVNRQINNETNLNNLTNIQLMYRDADLMDAFPEIGAALDIYAEETCTLNNEGKLLNIYSKSDRIRTVLEDLFTNRLQVHSVLPMIVRATCKYGNNYQVLHIDANDGVVGWRQLPVHDMLRSESGLDFLIYNQNANSNDDSATKFVWNGYNNTVPFKVWQVAHFRIMLDSLYLPYGISILHKARRAWRQLSLMEDMMLIYRLERSFERRIFKINVGGINDADVPAYIDDIANNFKRTPIIDPLTGQIDLRKNMIGVDQDIFVPVRGETSASPIDTLPGASNLDKIEDLTYIQRKIYTALRVPKSFISFDEAAGDGKNLALMDVRFAKMVNRIQQAILFELNKIATIHLYLLGFQDDLTNFSITMNNPSTQADIQRIEETQKRVTLARDALTDPGNGLQLMSWAKVQREIFHLNDKEIAEELNEIRLEKAVAGELDQTREIIKRTGVFDDVDKLYGEPNAQYSEPQQIGAPGEGGIGGGGGGFSGELGDEDFDIGDGQEGEEVQGESGEVPLNNMNTMESKKSSKTFLHENVIKSVKDKIITRPTDIYIKKLNHKEDNVLNENKMLNNSETDKNIEDICKTIDKL